MKRVIVPFLVLAVFLLPSCISEVRQQTHEDAVNSMNIGHAYLVQSNYTIALKELLKAEKIIHDDPYLEDDLGLAFMAKKRFALAEKHFKRAVKLKPDYIPAKNNLGTSYLKQKKWDLAISIFKSISKDLLYATPHYPLSNMGWAYIGKKEYGYAKESFSKALKLKPDFTPAVHGLATVFLKTSKGYSAVNILTRAIKNNPRAAIFHADLAKAYEIMEQFSKAKKSWETFISLAPESSLATEAKAHIKKLAAMP